MSQLTEKGTLSCRVTLSISFIVTFLVIVRNIVNKRKTDKILPKYVHLWSSATLFSIPIALLIYLSQRLPIICAHVSRFKILATAAPKILNTFYQLSRLQHCFASDRIPKEFGYSKRVFYFLYIYLSIFILWGLFASSFLQKPISIRNLGCIRIPKYKWLSLVNGIAAFFFLIGTWTTVILYIYKLRQLKNGICGQKRHIKQSIKRISLELNKILYLTIIYEIFTNCIVFANLYSKIFRDYGIGRSFDLIFLSIITYLMLAHNSTDYDKIAQICCKQTKNDNSTQSVEGKQCETTTVKTISLHAMSTHITTDLTVHTDTITKMDNLGMSDVTNTNADMDTEESQRTTTSELERNMKQNKIFFDKLYLR
eukprot:329338_1